MFYPYVFSSWADVCGIYRAAKLAAQEGRKYNTSPKKQLTNDCVAFATRAFATPILVASATPIFVASATPYFRTFATRTAATPKFFF